ncbi:RNA polymerase sigma factor [Actinokineospora fastidiosa]|uniref:DNA-directed RNA polymerase sigma-70 factor n=1 Tax=Actinokineospora fastidiosa TaxID=1816 RepID=A0A918LEM0_9PSEU|nr:sigma-70 family RNA polymerase sigma factor [Actinokineospora fastidiosa]GGS39053.1 DNA-directed RNA polymerase sigma-70 factor [Actinokineospora fastidiosa]
MAADDVRPDLLAEDAATVFGDLFDRYARSVHRYLARRVGEGAADDLLAETFVTAWAARRRYDPGRAAVRVWLFGIATNLCRKHRRDELRNLDLSARLSRREVGTALPESEAIDRVDAAARVGRLASALIALPAADRDVLLLTAWAGLTPAEAGAALGIPAGTARSRLHRARSALRTAEARLATAPTQDGETT